VSVAKIIELTSRSSESFEAACNEGVAKAAETIRGMQNAWVDGQEVVIENGKVVGYEVHLKITFLLD
jgi:dodecin